MKEYLDIALRSLAAGGQLWAASNYGNVCTLVVWLCDLSHSVSEEMRLIWTKPLSASSMLFVANRYSSLLYQVLAMGFNRPGSHASKEQCCGLFYALQTVMTLTMTTTGWLLAHRIFAIYYRSTALLIILGVLVFAPLCLEIYYTTLVTIISTKGTVFTSLSQCSIISVGHDLLKIRNPLFNTALPDGFVKSHLHVVLIRLIARSILPVIFDTIIIFLTIKKTLRHTADMRRMQQTSITELILRDGLLYYVAVLLMNLIQSFLDLDTMLSRDFATSSLGCSIPTFFTVLPSILVNRLVLNLRQFEPSGHIPATSRTWAPPVSAPALDEQGPPHIVVVPSQPIYSTAFGNVAGNLNSEFHLSRPETGSAMKTANTRTTLAAMGYSLPIALAFDGEEDFLENLPRFWGPSDEEHASGTR